MTLPRIVLLATFVAALAPSASAQTLPHNITDLCAADPQKTVVAAGSAVTLTGTHSCVEVRGSATVAGLFRAITVLQYPGSSLTGADGADWTMRDAPIDTVADPEQWGHGWVVVDATVRMAGQVKSHMVRLAAEPLAGQTVLQLPVPADWRVGDRLVLPDTRHLNNTQWFVQIALQHEVCDVAALGPGQVTCAAPLLFSHRGARNADGSLTLLPHVGHLTRSITIRSENPNGTRGHIAFLGRSSVDVRGVRFVDLGRTTTDATNTTTNIIGRYPVHFHHMPGPVNPTNTGYQYVFQGNVVEGGRKWPVAIHNTHFGLVKDNVIYGAGNFTGAGIALEDGSETDNLIEGNFIVDIRGTVHPRNTLPGLPTQGSSGDCIWGAGFNNRFVGNVLAGCRNYPQDVASGAGFKLAAAGAHFYTVRQPKFRGATALTDTISLDPKGQPILEMRGNEVYGLACCGMTLWWLNTDGYNAFAGARESVVQDFTVWHTYNGVCWCYPTNKLTYDGLVYRSPNVDGGATAWTAGDYMTTDLTIRNADIHAGAVFADTIDPQGVFRFENITATVTRVGFQFTTPATPGTKAKRVGKSISNEIVGGKVTAWPTRPLLTINMHHDVVRYGSDSQPFEPYLVKALNYQGSGANLDVYFAVQGTTNVYYGGMAPCTDTTTYPEINGITCLSGTTPPPPPPDSDGDGVPDVSDLCPGTPPGTSVDTTGCPLPPPPPTEVCNGIDDDGDGLIDEGCPVPNSPPTVTASCSPCAVKVNRLATLTAVGQDADGDPLTYTWSGPGTFGSAGSATTSWRHTVVGTHTLTVTVSDGQTATAATVTVKITRGRF